MANKNSEISEAKIRQVKWHLKKGDTKKRCCELLGIAYNTKRLQTIIDEFDAQQERIAELKKKARNKKFTDQEKKSIADAYLNGDSQAAIAERYYVSAPRIKKILLEMNVPIRSRKKNGEATVNHIIQDLDVKFKKGDKVFIPETSSFAIVTEVFDEEWVENALNPKNRRYIELHALEDARKKYGEDFEGVEDVHYNIYWEYDNGDTWKECAIKDKINRIESIIEETGREYYLVLVEGDYQHYTTKHRNKLYPVGITNGD